MAWNLIEKVISYVIQFSCTIFIARILAPSDYGLIGMLAIFLSLSNILVDSGFARALIQKKNRTETDFSTVFFFNLGISILIYFILFFSAPFIADFYSAPKLVMITRILSLTFVFNSLNIVQMTQLSIEMDFRTRALINTISTMVSFVLALGMAYWGCGVWALVAQNISKTAIACVMLTFIKRWKPLWTFSIASFKQLFNYSWKLLVASFISCITTNIFSLVIGKRFKETELGYYTKGQQAPTFISASLLEILHNVTFPVMSELQDEDARLLHVYRKLICFSMFCIMPCMIGFALLSEPLVRVFLTEKWLPAVPLMQWFCIGYIFNPISSLNINYLNAKGDSDLTLLLEILKLPVIIAILLIGYNWGVLALVIGRAAAFFIFFFINAYFPGKMTGYTAWKQLRDFIPTILSTLIMAAVVYPLVHFLPPSYDWLKLIGGSVLGAATYFGMAALFRLDEMKEIKNLIRGLKKKIHSSK